MKKKYCEHCGKEFVRTNFNQKYCCPEHRYAHQEKVAFQRVKERLMRRHADEKYSKEYTNFAVHYQVNVAAKWKELERPYPSCM